MTTDSYPRFARRAVGLAAFATVVVVLSCADPSGPADTIAGEAMLAKGGGGSGEVTVSATKPDTGSQGTTLDVTISGSGFTSDMAATWELDGVADPTQVRTNSTRYVSSKQLVANVTIAEGAAVAKWDVRVTSSRCCKGGIGIELFEVKVTGRPQDVAATFYIYQDNTLGMTSDGKFLEPTGSAYVGHSRYKDAECGSMSHIKTGDGETGDALMSSHYTSGRGCKDAPRKVRIAYNRIDVTSGSTTSEGVITTVTFMNVRKLQRAATSSEPGTAIPIGASELRSMALSDESYKCGAAGTGAILFSPVTSDGFETGANNVKVTRLSADHWLVETLPDEVADGTVIHNDAAWCRGNGQLYHMPLRLIVRSSVGLP